MKELRRTVLCVLAIFPACGGGDESSTEVTSSSGTQTETGTTAGPTDTEGGMLLCGNGEIDGDEVCDDGNKSVLDGCTAACLPTTAGLLGAGSNLTCALLDAGDVRCWGNNVVGGLGYGHLDNIGDDELPNTAGPVELGAAVHEIAVGYHVCALLIDGTVRCWGSSTFGKLGYGNDDFIGDDEVPTAVDPVELSDAAIQIDVGGTHSCAVLKGGKVTCWGDASSGQLGYGNTERIGDNETPASAGTIDLGGVATQVATGDSHTCALIDDGSVRCWGNGERGRLGHGSTGSIGDDEHPSSIDPIDLGGTAVFLTAGDEHTCALMATDTVRCWGRNADNELGYGHTDHIGDDEPPSAAGDVDVGGPVKAISAGPYNTCALLTSGQVRCWGAHDVGVPSAQMPLDVGPDLIAISRGSSHTCTMSASGDVYCWGQGAFGELGYGNVGLAEDNCAASPIYCDNGPNCCVGDMPGELPPPPVPFK
ncbi:MAG: hypothetical protein ACPG4T_14080 [Nannocystaceae bacterium]